MLIVERMKRNPLTVAVTATAGEALALLEDHRLRYLPVVDEAQGLVGILSMRDLMRVEAETAIGQVMRPDVITVTEFTPLEEAARVMADHRVGALPVVRSGKLVGIITETDVMNLFLELLGAREKGLRLTMLVPEERGMLASVTSEIAQMGGNILALSTFRGEDPTNRMVTVKVADVPRDRLLAIMEALGMEIVDVREA